MTPPAPEVSTATYQGPERRRESAKNSFWQINVGHALTLTAMIIGFITTINRFDARLTAVENAVSKQDARVLAIDEHGTQASRLAISQDGSMIASTERRTAKLEQQFSEMSPKLERIDVNLQWLLKKSP